MTSETPQGTNAGGPLRVVGLPGSLRDGSHTRQAVHLALAGAEDEGAETSLIDLRSYELPHCDGEDGSEASYPDIQRMRDELGRADGIILGTPEYHGGYSGVLKNALDLMGFDEFEGKMVGLVGVAGGALGGYGALNGLREVGRALHAWVIPQQAAIPRAWKAFDDAGALTDDKLAARVRGVGRQVARFAALHRSGEDALAFVRAWEQAQENPGGGDR